MRRLALGLLVIVVGCAPPRSIEGPIEAVVTFPDGAGELAVEVADSDRERRTGLMGRAELGEDRGMAFVFDAPVDGSFWMKDTLIPLSIAFVNQRGRVVTVTEMAPCTADPCVRYRASAPYVLAIEANRGWFDDHGVEVGDIARLERTDG